VGLPRGHSIAAAAPAAGQACLCGHRRAVTLLGVLLSCVLPSQEEQPVLLARHADAAIRSQCRNPLQTSRDGPMLSPCRMARRAHTVCAVVWCLLMRVHTAAHSHTHTRSALPRSLWLLLLRTGDSDEARRTITHMGKHWRNRQCCRPGMRTPLSGVSAGPPCKHPMLSPCSWRAGLTQVCAVVWCLLVLMHTATLTRTRSTLAPLLWLLLLLLLRTGDSDEARHTFALMGKP
jgi:hypothetical protein